MARRNGSRLWPDRMSWKGIAPGRPSGAVAAVTHERLVTIAREPFSQCGYDGTTFAEVARAGLTRPALYYPGR
jgi:AcrR family transcriptional regulator